MKKMKLELDTLCVESFATHVAQGARGTVRGKAVAGDVLQPATPTLQTDPSYEQTCIFYTCGGCTTEDPAYC